MASREQLIETLTARLREIERPRLRSGRGGSSAGLRWPGLAGWLASRGIARGCLIEWLAEGPGAGSATLAWLAVRDLARHGDVVVLLDSQKQFFAPGANTLGVPPRQVVLLQPERRDDGLWSLEQALRCRGVGVVMCEVERLSARQFRRLQLAAEAGGTWGLLLRPAGTRRQPSWADVRLLIEPRPSPAASGRRWRLEILRVRGAAAGDVACVEFDDATDGLRLVSELAAATTAIRAVGA